MIDELDDDEKQALIEEQRLIDSQFELLDDEDQCPIDEFGGTF